MSEKSVVTGVDLICDQLASAGIKCVASLPDDWFIPLLRTIDERGFKHISVSREHECVGVAMGAFFAGVPAVACMGIAGLLTCFHEFATVNLTYQMPLYILASRRGGLDDSRTYQTSQGTVGIPALEALTIHHHTIDRIEDLGLIQAGYERSRVLKRPFITFLTKQVIEYREETA